jgi:quercetin dioxygenase-like cupin family protein
MGLRQARGTAKFSVARPPRFNHAFGVIAMRLIEFSTPRAEPITLFESVAASSRLLADGLGDAHVHCLHFEPGGKIGEHSTGFGQLFLVIAGAGWAAGADGRRVEVHTGQAVYFERGERHSKGSDRGMIVLMVQVTDLQLHVSVVNESNR